jgi:putative addiction module killer protein
MRVRQTRAFSTWLSGLSDLSARAAILRRIARLAAGNPGDVAPVGDGVSELRVHVGAGWRVYFIQRGQVLVILLCGGSKRTQSRDIARAKRLAVDPDLDLEVTSDDA